MQVSVVYHDYFVLCKDVCCCINYELYQSL
jgi:hypothetical protein